MIVRNRTYNLEYGGTVHSIKRDDLVRMTNHLAASYKHATAARKRVLWGIILKLNWKYITNTPPYQFTSSMDREDYLSWVFRYMPKALENYQESMGGFCTYLASWKHAALSRWQDEKNTIRAPSNVRTDLQAIAKKVRHGRELTEREKEILAEPIVQVCSLSAPIGGEDSQLYDAVVGEDPREKIGGATYNQLWKQIQNRLSAGDFQIFHWYHHDDYRLSLDEIGARIGVTRERVRQRLRDMQPKLARKFKLAEKLGKGAL